MGVEKIKEKRIIRTVLRLVTIFVTAILIMLFIEWRFFGNDFKRTFNFAFIESVPVFYYNVLLLFFLELFISSFFKATWTGPGVTFILSIIISYINASKYTFRGQPLLPEDFMLADQTGTLTKFIDFSSLIRTILACFIAFGLMILLNNLSKKMFGSAKDPKDFKGGFFSRNFRGVRIGMAVIAMVGFISGTSFIRNHNGEKVIEVPFLQSSFIAWNQMYNYEINGFIIGFMYNFQKFEMTEPEGYSKEVISEIKEKYSSSDESKTRVENSGINVITILNESFYDPSVISEYYPISKNPDISENSMGIPVTEDVIPTIRRLRTGQMYSTDYGGGTANIEFEVDTTMSNYWANTVPFVDLFPHVESVPSVASTFSEAGFDTVAIHPFNGGMYKRNIALPKEGIDEFITEDEMEFTEKDDGREYINDRSAYKETLKVLSEHKNNTYVSLITMQNHAGYGGDGYSSRSYLLADSPRSGEDMSGFSEDEKTQVEVYLESLHNSDYYLSEFLEELGQLDEKTVVLFYGDHAPGIFPRVEGSSDKSVRDLSRLTPYFVWTNFSEVNSELPTTTPNCLSNTMFDLLDLEKPDFMKLSSEVCKVEPILTQSYFGNGAPAQSTGLKEYELYIYDILGGKRYWLED